MKKKLNFTFCRRSFLLLCFPAAPERPPHPGALMESRFKRLQ